METTRDVSAAAKAGNGGPLQSGHVVVLGPEQSGKTSVVRSLLHGCPHCPPHYSPTEGVVVDVWTPFATHATQYLLNRNLTEEERHLVLELWDTSGRQVCNAVHGIFLTPKTLCVIVYDVNDDRATEKVLALYQICREKCEKSHVVVVGNKVDLVHSSSDGGSDSEVVSRDRVLHALLQHDTAARNALIAEIQDTKALLEECSADGKDPKSASERRQSAIKDSSPKQPTPATDLSPAQELLQHHLACLKRRLELIPSPSANLRIVTVSAFSGWGLDSFRQVVLEAALDLVKSHCLRNRPQPSATELYGRVLALRDTGVVILPWKQFLDMTSRDENIAGGNVEEDVDCLAAVGAVTEFRLRTICFPTPPEPDLQGPPSDAANAKEALESQINIDPGKSNLITDQKTLRNGTRSALAMTTTTHMSTNRDFVENKSVTCGTSMTSSEDLKCIPKPLRIAVKVANKDPEEMTRVDCRDGKDRHKFVESKAKVHEVCETILRNPKRIVTNEKDSVQKPKEVVNRDVDTEVVGSKVSLQDTDCKVLSDDDTKMAASKEATAKVDMAASKEATAKVDDAASLMEERYICVYPALLATAVCCCLIDDDKMSFRVEAGRFWPKDSGFKHPDPGLLGRVLESIPQQGLLRECLLPLLWQEYPLGEEQVLHMLHVLQALGLAAQQGDQKYLCEGLALPHFPALSVQRCHALPLLALLPHARPQLNWTTKPFVGDIQITWSFHLHVHQGLLQRLLAGLLFLSRKCSNYCHLWRTGVLLRVGEATVCAEQRGEQRLDVSCRVNADEPGRETEACRLLWVTLAPFLVHVRRALHTTWAGIHVKETMVALGRQFYLDDDIDEEPDLWVLDALSSWQRHATLAFKQGVCSHHIDTSLLLPFTPDRCVSDVDGWLSLVMTYTSRIARDAALAVTSCLPSPADDKASKRLSMRSSVRLPKKKKSVEVKWQIEGEGTKIETKDDKVPRPSQKTIDADTITVNNKQPEDTSLVLPIGPTMNFNPDLDPVDLGQPEVGELSIQDRQAETLRLASGFVAAILASAVADFVAQEAGSERGGQKVISTAQITAARVTAEAALAVQMGNIQGAATAVIEAVNAVKGDNSVTTSKGGNKSSGGSAHSKLCTLL